MARIIPRGGGALVVVGMCSIEEGGGCAMVDQSEHRREPHYQQVPRRQLSPWKANRMQHKDNLRPW